MKKTSIYFCLASVLFLNSCKQPQKGIELKPAFIAYYANFDFKRPVDKFDLTGLEYIIHFAIYPTYRAEIDSSQLKNIDSLIKKAHDSNVKVLACLGPNRGALPIYVAIAKDTILIKKLGIQLANFCKRHNYDGADLDWEKPEISDTLSYLDFVRIVNRELKRYNLKFSITLPGQHDKTFYLKHNELAKNVDWINLMTYDYGNTNDKQCRHITPFEDIKKDVSLFNADVPLQKLVLGLSFYGRKYNKVDKFQIGEPGEREGNLYPVDSIWPKVKDTSWIKKFDCKQGVPFMYKPKLHQLISFDSDSSFRLKCDYVKDIGLKGVMYWAVDYDAKQYKNSWQKVVLEKLGE